MNNILIFMDHWEWHEEYKGSVFLNFILIEFIEVVSVNKIMFQIYSSMTHHLYIVLCVHHPKSNLP